MKGLQTWSETTDSRAVTFASHPCHAAEELAHWILAAADFCLVPSRFEPCGLVAQAGIRYGCVPIVTRVGGLKDLVTPEVSQPPASATVQHQPVQRDWLKSSVYSMLPCPAGGLLVSWVQPGASCRPPTERAAACRRGAASGGGVRQCPLPCNAAGRHGIRCVLGAAGRTVGEPDCGSVSAAHLRHTSLRLLLPGDWVV